MKYQVDGLRNAIQEFKNNHSSSFASGYNLVCHSQGALVCRAFLMTTKTHGVSTYFSLSGPHLGQYGVIGEMEKFFPNLTTETSWRALYTEEAQLTFSASNYWNDPFHQQKYLEAVKFLPELDNLTTNNDSQSYKQNFLETETVILYGSKDDGTIQPYQSAFFGFWQDNSRDVIIPMQNQSIFDTIGLSTLQTSGRLIINNVTGVEHTQWLFDQTLFEKYIEPFLT